MVPSLLLFKPTPKKKRKHRSLINPHHTHQHHQRNHRPSRRERAGQSCPKVLICFDSSASQEGSTRLFSSAWWLPEGDWWFFFGSTMKNGENPMENPWSIEVTRDLPAKPHGFCNPNKKVLDFGVLYNTKEQDLNLLASWDPHPMKLSGCHHRRIGVMERLFGNLLSVLLFKRCFAHDVVSFLNVKIDSETQILAEGNYVIPRQIWKSATVWVIKNLDTHLTPPLSTAFPAWNRSQYYSTTVNIRKPT